MRRTLAFITSVALVFAGLTGFSAAMAASGDLDPSFGTGGKVTTEVDAGGRGYDLLEDLAVYPPASPHAGKLIAAGTAGIGGYGTDIAIDVGLVRYNLDGSLDTSFGNGGIVTTDFGLSAAVVRAVILQPDDKILVAGNDARDFLVARFNPDGTVDQSFGNAGFVTTDFGDTARGSDVALQDDGKIVVVGTRGSGSVDGDFAVARYTSNGSLDPTFGDRTFGEGGKVWADFDPLPLPPLPVQVRNYSDDVASAVAIDDQGRIVVVGESFVWEDWTSYWGLMRFTPDGTLDADFGNGGKLIDIVGGARDVALQGDDKIVATGYVVSPNGWYDLGLVRYMSDGRHDPGFGDGGIATASVDPNRDEIAMAIAIQSDGAIVTAGTASLSAPTYYDFVVARHNPDGSLDETFGSGGTVVTEFFMHDMAFAVALLPDGRIVAGGLANRQFGLARYLSGDGPDPDPEPSSSPTPEPSSSPTPEPSVSPTPERAGSIEGKVTSHEGKKPLAGASVVCEMAGSAVTAADGTYAMADVTPGSYSCTASLSGYKALTKSVSVDSNATATVNFALKKA